jgi:hypothetical protein
MLWGIEPATVAPRRVVQISAPPRPITSRWLAGLLRRSSQPTRIRRARERPRPRPGPWTSCGWPAGETGRTGAAGPPTRERRPGVQALLAAGDLGADARMVLVGPGRLDQLGAQVGIAGLGQVPANGPLAAGVLAGDQPAEPHELARPAGLVAGSGSPRRPTSLRTDGSSWAIRSTSGPAGLGSGSPPRSCHGQGPDPDG